MRRRWTWVARIAAGLAGLILVAVAVIWGWSESILSRTHSASTEQVRAAGSPNQIAAGRRLAAAIGCPNCHGANLQGEVFVDVPYVARVHAPNLPLLAQKLSDAQLAQSIRQGVRPDGRALFGMPSEMYVHLHDDELAALLGYLRSLPVSGEAMPPNQWRVAGRVGLLAQQIQPAPVLVAKTRMKRALDVGQHGNGRHTALIACSECHGPDLAGLPRPFGDPPMPDLAVAAAYDGESFRRLMRTGIARGDRKVGLMSAVSRSRFAHFTDEEIDELHAYLKVRAEALQPPSTAK